MTEAQIKHMVDRFLSWKLPADFNPDRGVHFDAEAARKIDAHNHRYEPVGTNLFTAVQADTMIRHMLEALPAAQTVNVGDDVVEMVARAIGLAIQFQEPFCGKTELGSWVTTPQLIDQLENISKLAAKAALAAIHPEGK